MTMTRRRTACITFDGNEHDFYFSRVYRVPDEAAEKTDEEVLGLCTGLALVELLTEHDDRMVPHLAALAD